MEGILLNIVSKPNGICFLALLETFFGFLREKKGRQILLQQLLREHNHVQSIMRKTSESPPVTLTRSHQTSDRFSLTGGWNISAVVRILY